MDWRLEGTFPELAGFVKGPGGRNQLIEDVLQITKLRLDRKGVEMKSLAVIVGRGAHEGRAYAFDRPFLLALRTRGSALPYFLLWVEAPPLLVPTTP